MDVTIPRDDVDAEPTGTVALWENGVQAEGTVSVPARFLQPIHPSQLGTTVVIFKGPLAGKQGIIRSTDVDEEMFVVQLLEDQVLEDIQRESMTLCVCDNIFE